MAKSEVAIGRRMNGSEMLILSLRIAECGMSNPKFAIRNPGSR